MSTRSTCRVGTAGWSIPRALQGRFPEGRSHLERYGKTFDAVEINSSFYRRHEPETYERWARETPATFRFAVKLARDVTHFHRLAGPKGAIASFLEGPRRLGRKLGPILVQLPPSLRFESKAAKRFFDALAKLHAGPVACEPRHPSWFDGEADRLLESLGVARVAADPACVPEAGRPGGSRRLVYYRLHGSPRMYVSEYGEGFARRLAREILALPKRTSVWCIFDNTASGAAAADALRLLGALGARAP
ncbi:MAG: DUF72 domain-containing protein [Planctomycetota bacterium]